MRVHNQVGFHSRPANAGGERVSIGGAVFGVGDVCFIHVSILAGYTVVVNIFSIISTVALAASISARHQISSFSGESIA